MKHLKLSTIVVVACLLLSACSTTALRYTIEVDAQDATEVLRLINATENVAKRKIAALDTKGTATAVPKGGSQGELSITLADSSKAADVNRILTNAFSIDIRSLKPDAEKKKDADLQVSDWVPTGIVSEHFKGVQMVGDKASGEVGVELQFTPEGTKLLGEVFKAHKGGNIGIFVRDLLMSRLVIKDDKPGEHIVINGIPSAAVAEVFADDVNVGLRIKLVPQQ